MTLYFTNFQINKYSRLKQTNIGVNICVGQSFSHFSYFLSNISCTLNYYYTYLRPSLQYNTKSCKWVCLMHYRLKLPTKRKKNDLKFIILRKIKN